MLRRENPRKSRNTLYKSGESRFIQYKSKAKLHIHWGKVTSFFWSEVNEQPNMVVYLCIVYTLSMVVYLCIHYLWLFIYAYIIYGCLSMNTLSMAIYLCIHYLWLFIYVYINYGNLSMNTLSMVVKNKRGKLYIVYFVNCVISQHIWLI